MIYEYVLHTRIHIYYILCRNYLQFSIWKSLKPFSKYSDGYCWVPKGKVLLAKYIFTTHRHIMYILSYSRAIIYPVHQDVPRSSKHPISSVNNVFKKIFFHKYPFCPNSLIPMYIGTCQGHCPHVNPQKYSWKLAFASV